MKADHHIGAAVDSLRRQGRRSPPRQRFESLFTHTDSGHAVPELPVWLRWPDPKQKESIDPVNPRMLIIFTDSGPTGEQLLGVQSLTDVAGGATFCGVPAGTRLELVMLRPDDDPEVREWCTVRASHDFRAPGG